MLLRGGLLLFLGLTPASAATGFAGAAACRPCHAAIFAEQSTAACGRDHALGSTR